MYMKRKLEKCLESRHILLAPKSDRLRITLWPERWHSASRFAHVLWAELPASRPLRGRATARHTLDKNHSLLP